MADWTKIISRGSVSDRRGLGGIGVGGSLVSVILLMGITYALGGNPLSVLTPETVSQIGNSLSPAEDTAQYEGVDAYEEFVSTVLGSANEYWTDTLSGYTEPTLVLFRGQTTSACGGASAVVGPHYCSLDSTIYLDETFFEEVSARLGNINTDVAQAYVIAHEVGHHVQQIQGTLDSRTNEQSVAVELTADCYAGAWFYSISDDLVLAENEIQEALTAAAAVGDDNIQRSGGGRIQPESWTHGSSEDRTNAFLTGFQSGDPNTCQF